MMTTTLTITMMMMMMMMYTRDLPEFSEVVGSEVEEELPFDHHGGERGKCRRLFLRRPKSAPQKSERSHVTVLR